MKVKCNYNFNANDILTDMEVEVDENGQVTLAYETKFKMLLISFNLEEFLKLVSPK